MNTNQPSTEFEPDQCVSTKRNIDATKFLALVSDYHKTMVGVDIIIPILPWMQTDSPEHIVELAKENYILAVDDDRTIIDRELYRYADQGFVVIIARDTRSAMAIVRQFGIPRVLALDYYLAGGHNIESFIERFDMHLFRSNEKRHPQFNFYAHSGDFVKREKTYKIMNEVAVRHNLINHPEPIKA